MGVYQPLGWMLAELEYTLSGLNPRGYHLASLFLHMAAVVLYVLTFSLVGYCQPANDLIPRGHDRFVLSGLMTAMFAVHPLRVESVAWYLVRRTCRVACSPCLAYCVTCGLMEITSETPQFTVKWLALSIGLFAASLLSKEASLGLPGVLLILDIYPLHDSVPVTGQGLVHYGRMSGWKSCPTLP